MPRENFISVSAENAYPLSNFRIPVHYEDSLSSVLIPHGMIEDRVERLAEIIRDEYAGKTIHLLCVLKGGSAFFNSLIEKLRLHHQYTKSKYIPFTFDFIRVQSYDGTQSTGKVKITGANEDSFRGKNLLLVEDIIDTGNTMTKLLPTLNAFEPQSVKVASLLEKRTEKSCGYKADFVGFEIPDSFVVGYCLDYNEVFRDLDHICIINDKGIEKWKEGV